MPTEDQQTPTEKSDAKANPNAHNNLAVTITISPPTPVPGDRRLIGSEDNPDDCIADARESYDVIDLYEEEETATSQEAVQSQQASTVVVEKQDSNDGENIPPGTEDGSKTVMSATQIESTTFKSSGETTTRVTSSTTTTSKIITQTEVITVNESNEEASFLLFRIILAPRSSTISLPVKELIQAANRATIVIVTCILPHMINSCCLIP